MRAPTSFVSASLLLFSASIAFAQDAGQAAFQVCAACHSVGTQGNKVEGPNLLGIVGRKIASQPGYKYSEAMKKYAVEHQAWTEELLDQYIKNAEEVVPGTSMNNSPSVRSANTRKSIVEYLKAQK